jgi:ferritin-like metal-binding protein YciE
MTQTDLMTKAAREIFIVGLRNAHAMEIQARELMERQSERLTDHPEVLEKVKGHLFETNEQLVRIERCLDELGEATSALKDTAQSVIANMMAMGHSIAGDEILKNTFANNAFENFEIAAYRSLLILGDAAGHSGARPRLEQSLEEEERMASWVAANVEKITVEYLQHAAREAAA